MKLKTLFCLSLIAVIASLSPVAYAQTYSVIHTFDERNGDGGNPITGVTIRGSILYGTTNGSGRGQDGTLYQLSLSGNNWLYGLDTYFSPDAGGPTSRVAFGPDGHPYGVSLTGGNIGGTVWRVLPPVRICALAACSAWKVNTLHFFEGAPQDGYGPSGDLIFDQQGNIYGVTNFGGAHDSGTVFEMMGSGNNWTETPIYQFTGGADGSSPIDGVTFDSNGNLFGVTIQGGANNHGTIFELTHIPSGWQETVLYNFTGGSDGKTPVGGLIVDGSGNFYGTTSEGGSGGCGTAFELSPSGQTWTLTTLASFSGSLSSCGPRAKLTLDSVGNLYGTTFIAGANQKGAVFKLSNTQNGWVYTSLYDFTEGSDGGQPISTVSIDTDGSLYGTAWAGGLNFGVVWQIKP